MVVPMAVLFFAFHTIPFLQGIFYSFTNWQGYGSFAMTGLRNYARLFTDPAISGAYLFTFKFAIIATIAVNVLSLLVALGLNAKIRFKSFLRATYFLPYMLSTLIVGFIFTFVFSSLLPQLAQSLSIKALSTNILGTDNAWIGVLIVTVWQSMAFNTLIYLSGLQTIDADVNEAALLDGATGWTKFRTITFPLLAPFFTINMVLSGKNFLMIFDQIIAMTGGGPGTSTTSISVLIYQKGLGAGQFGIQSANSVLLFIIVVVISFFQLRVLEKREDKLS
jgi:raffinose/stachyose/melibiose transport system permease protein